MKKITQALLLGSLLSVSSLSANGTEDILSLATKGQVSETMDGIRRLSALENNEIKGGVYVHLTQYRGVTDNFGMKRYLTGYYGFYLTGDEKRTGTAQIRPNGSYSASDYRTIQNITILDPQNENITVKVEYDFTRNRYSTPQFIVFNKQTKVSRDLYHPIAEELYNNYKERIDRDFRIRIQRYR